MYYKIFIIIIACCSAYFCYGQSKQYITPGSTIYITKYDSNPPPLNFRSFGFKDGLPRGTVTAFLQSDDGYVWFSIPKLGLVRFDGYHFRIFKPIANDSTSLPDDYILGMAKSHKKGLWLASAYGIIWFDLTTYKSKLIPLPSQYVESGGYGLFEDSRKRLWVYKFAGASSLLLYDFLNNKFTGKENHFATDAFTGEKINIDKAFFIDLKESEDGNLFISGKYLLKFNPVSFEFIIVYKKINDQFFFNTFIIDEDNKHIWFSGWKGFLKYNYKNDSLINYNFQNMQSSGDIENHTFVSPKNNTQLWLPNEQQIRVFDKITGKVFLYKKSNTENLSVTERNAKGINGTEWFWDYRTGFAALLPGINRFIYHKVLPPDERVLCRWYDTINNITWFGTEDRGQIAHLYKYNTGTNKFIRINIPVKGIGAVRFIIPLLNNICLVAQIC